MARRKAEFSPDDAEAARARALRLLAVRARATSELRDRLKRVGYAVNVVESVISDLAGAGLLDDAEFARSWVESRQASGGIGRGRLRWELRRKGVAEELTEAALAKGASDEREAEQALALARKRMQGKPEDPKQAVRVRRWLVSRGFGYGLVDWVMRRISSDEES